jgi:hypothetical protein
MGCRIGSIANQHIMNPRVSTRILVSQVTVHKEQHECGHFGYRYREVVFMRNQCAIVIRKTSKKSMEVFDEHNIALNLIHAAVQYPFRVRRNAKHLPRRCTWT